MHDRGFLNEAEPLLRQSLSAREAKWGHENTFLIRVLTSLALLLRDRGVAEEAVEVCERALTLGRSKLREDDPYLARCLYAMGLLALDRGKHDRAEEYLRESLSLYVAAIPSVGWQTAQVKSALGACLLEADGVEEAQPLLLDAYEALAENRGRSHRRTLETVQSLIALYEKLGQATDADAWREAYRVATNELVAEQAGRAPR